MGMFRGCPMHAAIVVEGKGTSKEGQMCPCIDVILAELECPFPGIN